MNRKVYLTVAVLALLAFSVGGLGQGSLSIGIILPSPQDDLGFSQSGRDGVLRAAAQLGNLEVEIVDSVGFGDVEAILSDLATRHDILIAESNGYLDGTIPVALRHPGKFFLVRNTEVVTRPIPGNLVMYDLNFGSVGWVQGVIAGLLTRTNIIGDIDSLPVLIRFANIRGLICGARFVNPNTT
ncbi:MAG: BMP family ABC transporter substrate-binding protein, partial [Deinococcus sp.]|nr:BMP family ABC transporter substrate-binding protein [Deinococcus sp.]